MDQHFAASRKEGTGGSKRPKGYVPWRPHRKNMGIIGQVKDILSEYEAELPLTARLISFDAIRDDGASCLDCNHYAGEEAFYRHVRELGQRYERDKLANQKVDIRVYCEAAGMMPQVSRVSSRYSVPVYSCSGFDSLTAKYGLSRDIVEAFACRGRRTVILHVGDHDPSGESIFDVIAEDVCAFVSAHIAHKDPEDVALFRRVALTPELIREHNLPTVPPKRSDSRSNRWRGRETCQLEALPPDVLADMLAAEIERYLDLQILRADREVEAVERRQIDRLLPAAGRAS